MKKTMFFSMAFMCLGVLPATTALADGDSIESASTLKSSSEVELAEKMAGMWDLSVEEWKEYQLIMQGPRGTWTPGLDPITVLGINAKSDSKRKLFAEKLAKLERARVIRELAFEMAYQAAQKKLFSHIPLYEVTNGPAKASAGLEGKTINFFVKFPCGECKKLAVQHLSAGDTVNFYFVSADREEIKTWALEVGVTANMIGQQKVTLNHGSSRAKRLGIKKYPFVEDIDS